MVHRLARHGTFPRGMGVCALALLDMITCIFDPVSPWEAEIWTLLVQCTLNTVAPFFRRYLRYIGGIRPFLSTTITFVKLHAIIRLLHSLGVLGSWYILNSIWMHHITITDISHWTTYEFIHMKWRGAWPQENLAIYAEQWLLVHTAGKCSVCKQNYHRYRQSGSDGGLWRYIVDSPMSFIPRGQQVICHDQHCAKYGQQCWNISKLPKQCCIHHLCHHVS